MAKDDAGNAEIEEYTKKLSSNPESLVFVPLAEVYRKSGLLDQAIETCLKGLQNHPSYMSARMVLGRAYLEKEMYDEAATELQKVSAADANNIMAHSLLGQVYMKQGKFAGAVEEFQKVLAGNPDDHTAQKMLAQALELAKQNHHAREDEGSSGKDKRQEISKAEELTKQGDVESALKIYRLILEADPENLVVRQRLKDLEIRKAQNGLERKGTERGKPEIQEHDNDKITSDDILSVMKDTVVKISEKPAAESKPAVASPSVDPGSAKAAAQAHGSAAAEGAGGEILPALQKLMENEGILGSMLLDNQGAILTQVFRQAPENMKEIAASVSVILGKTERATQAMDYGREIRQILITGEKGQIIFHRLGNKILLVLANDNINLGKMRLAMNDIVRVVRG